MSVTPGIVWQTITAVDGSVAVERMWNNVTLLAGAPSGVTMSHVYQLRAVVLTLGSASVTYPFDVVCSAGSDNFQVTSGLTPLKAGMVVSAPDVVPNGLQIVGVDQPASGSVLLGGGWSPAMPTTPWVYSQPATSTLAASLLAVDQYPYGTLSAAVTPSAGVTVTDWNYDQTGALNVGDGQAMSNSGFQAVAYFGATFPSAGTYEIAVSYMSYDEDYTDTSDTLVVTVT
ncbi:hypothetical protein [Conexibacter sp. S30A1]|uniref:hypothetical protein n=1 Tax=Conexibacter sp. S30A1 TaxID=2937800 RepID=UPI00200BC98D|nr:hypothetical protein [Conexibacter sp. S30A1]